MKRIRRTIRSLLLVYFVFLTLIIVAFTAIVSTGVIGEIDGGNTFGYTVSNGYSGNGGLPGDTGSSNPVVQMALAMAAHLHCEPNPLPGLDCNDPRLQLPLDAWYDSGFPKEVLQWVAVHCPGCAAWQNGNFQCVVFVIASYLNVKPLPIIDQNANQFWAYFATQPGWIETQIPQPGDIMVWAGGPFGHVSIVVNVTATSITFAQANAQMPVQTLPLNPDHTVNVDNGYWNGFRVQGYIRPISF